MKLRLTLTVVALCMLTFAFGQNQRTFKTCYVEGDNCVSVTYAAGTTSTPSAPSCAGRHIVFDRPNKSPKSLPRLGTNPQFGTLKNYRTTQEVYDHLHRTYDANEKGNAIELDKLWQAMGYDGFKDSRYTVDKVTQVFYPAGITGMLGAGGNSYLYASISPGQDIQLTGYRMTSMDGCDVTIMEICGNAFYPQNQPQSRPISTPSQVISKKVCPLNLPPTDNPGGRTISSFIKDGKCHVRVCDRPAGMKPAEIISNLSHNQQFGTMIDLKTADQVYARLEKLYSENKRGDRAELDRLFRSIGYTGGFKDNRLSASSINIVRYEGGVLGMMGSGEHQYMFSEVSSEKYDVLRGFEVKSLNEECDLTIIDICGNFLSCPQPLNCKTYECNCD